MPVPVVLYVKLCQLYKDGEEVDFVCFEQTDQRGTEPPNCKNCHYQRTGYQCFPGFFSLRFEIPTRGPKPKHVGVDIVEEMERQEQLGKTSSVIGR